eukprot:7378550-Prymnesium_polylepis.1
MVRPSQAHPMRRALTSARSQRAGHHPSHMQQCAASTVLPKHVRARTGGQLERCHAKLPHGSRASGGAKLPHGSRASGGAGGSSPRPEALTRSV